MDASVPLIVYPVTVTGLAVPTFGSANDATGVPPNVTTSLPSGAIVAVPLKVATVVASYALLFAVTPVTARSAGVMLAA